MRIKNAKAEKPTSTRPPLKPHSSPTQFNMHRTVSERQPFFCVKQTNRADAPMHARKPAMSPLPLCSSPPCSSIFPACFLLFLLSPGSSDIPGQLIFPFHVFVLSQQHQESRRFPLFQLLGLTLRQESEIFQNMCHPSPLFMRDFCEMFLVEARQYPSEARYYPFALVHSLSPVVSLVKFCTLGGWGCFGRGSSS